MRIKKDLIILLMCLALPMVGQAQSAHWAVSPIYQSVTRFASNLFKIKTAMSTGICDEEEKWGSVTFHGLYHVLNQWICPCHD